MPSELTDALPLALAVLAGAVVQSAFGFGLGLVVAPVAVSLIGVNEMITTVLVLGTVVNLLILLAEDHPAPLPWREAFAMCFLALPGCLMGALLVLEVPGDRVKALIGVLVIAFSARRALTSKSPEKRPQRADPLLSPRSVGLGLLTGALTTSSGLNGPGLVWWLQDRGATGHDLRVRAAASLTTLALIGMLILWLVGDVGQSVDGLVLALLLLPLVLIGHQAGRALTLRSSPERFERLVAFVILLSGVATVVFALT